MFGRICFAVIVFLFAGRSNVLAAPGDLDTAFNPPNGYVVYDGAAHGDDFSHTVAVQPDGKIVVAGSEDVDHPELGEMAPAILVLRFTSIGMPDPSFGNNGVFKDVITKVGDIVYALAIQPDGGIFFGGDSGVGEEAFVGRLNSNGTLDTGFGASLGWVNGYYRINYPGPPEVTGYTRFGGMALQPDGKIILAANVYAYETNERIGVAILRRNSNGTADGTFGSGGALFLSAAGRHDNVRSLVIQQDGKIVLAGYTYTADDPNNYNILLMRLNSDGVLDGTFGTDGFVIKDFSQRDVAMSVAIQRDGKIVAAGSIEGNNVGDTDVAVLRFDNSGVLDSAFGTGGVVRTALFEENEALGLAIQQNNKIVVTGYGHDLTFFALRYDDSGSLDNTFVPPDGFGSCNSTGTYANSMALQSDGKIAIAGSCNSGEFFEFNDVMVLRLLGDPVSPETIIDNRDANTFHTGTWYVSGASGAYGPDSVWSRDGSTFTWNFTPAETGTYNVSMWWTERPSRSTEILLDTQHAGDVSMWWTEWPLRSTKIPVDIQHAGGTSQVYINQRKNGGKWNLLGSYIFNAGVTYSITITSKPGPSSTCADAVKID